MKASTNSPRPRRPLDPRERANRMAKAISQGLLVAALGIALFLHFFNARFSSLNNWKAFDSAQVARNVAKGEGLRTSVIYPLSLTLKHPDLRGLDIRQAPLYPLVLSFFFRASKADDKTVAMANGFLHLLTGWLLYGLLVRLYDRRVALVGVLAYFCSLEALGQALTGNGTTLAALLTTAAILLALQLASGEPKTSDSEVGQRSRISLAALLWALAVGIVLGLAYLTDDLGLLAVLVLGSAAVLMSTTRQRPATAAAVTLAFALTVAPWLTRNYLGLHTLSQPLQDYELVMHTRSFPGHSILWNISGAPPNPFSFALTHPGQMAMKFVKGLVTTYRALPNVVSPYLWPFLALGYFLTRQKGLRARVWKVVGLLALVQVGTTSLYDLTDPRRVYVLVPIAWGLAVAAAMQFGHKYLPTSRARWTLAAVLGGLVFFPYLTGAWIGGKLPQTPSVKNLGIIAHAVDPRDLLASDVAWAVAWYADRRAMLLPGTLEQLKRLAEMKYEPSYIYLSRYLGGSRRYGPRPQVWADLLRGRRRPQDLGLGVPLPMPGGELLLELPSAKYKISDKLREAGKLPAAANTCRQDGLK